MRVGDGRHVALDRDRRGVAFRHLGLLDRVGDGRPGLARLGQALPGVPPGVAGTQRHGVAVGGAVGVELH